MEEKEILERIVAENGNCSAFADSNTCKICPMSRLKLRPGGGYYSCIEALNAHNIPLAEQDAVYKAQAERMLTELAIDEMLKNDI